MRDVEGALLETEQFRWSKAQGRFALDEETSVDDTYAVVAGIPADDDVELFLEQRLTAVFLALPDAAVKDETCIRPISGAIHPQRLYASRSLPDERRARIVLDEHDATRASARTIVYADSS